MKTHLDLVESLKLPRWSGPNGSKFIGIVVGVTNDMMTDGATIALLAQFSTADPQQPMDALDLLGDDCNRPHYPTETYASLRSRILGKWDFWTGSIKAGLSEELFAAGFPDVTFRVPCDVEDPQQLLFNAANALRSAYNVHRQVGPGVIHVNDDVTNIPVAPIATNEFTFINLVNDLADKFYAHTLDVGGVYHFSPDTINGVDYALVLTFREAAAILIKLVKAFNKHLITLGVHVPDDTFNAVTADMGEYWSRFFVELPDTAHSVTGVGTAVVGTAVVGTSIVGPAGLTASDYNLMRRIVAQYKPGQWVAWDYEFTLSGGEVIRLMGKKRAFDPDYVYFTP